MAGYSNSSPRLLKKAKGKLPAANEREMRNGGSRTWRDKSIELSDESEGPRPRRSNQPTKSPVYDGLPTLPTITDPDEPSTSRSRSKPPPPAPSASMAKKDMPDRPGTRKRRSSSIKRKPSPGVTPTKVVDWEIPRKTLHSSIG